VVLLGHAICWERNKSKKVFLLTILDQKKTSRTKIEHCLYRVRWHLHFFAFAFEWMTNIPFLWKLNQKWLDIRLTRVWVSVWGRLSSLKIDKKCFLLFLPFLLFWFLRDISVVWTFLLFSISSVYNNSRDEKNTIINRVDIKCPLNLLSCRK
jgi:hypothetical protein